jgi:hypothetical protein
LGFIRLNRLEMRSEHADMESDEKIGIP